MPSSKPKVMVTGGAGYIGSHLVRMLLARGYAVRVLDSLLFGDESLRPVMNGAGNVELIHGDIRRLEDVTRAAAGCVGLVHLAGIVGDPACELDPAVARDINVEATRVLVQVARATSIPRFVFASTCSVYGAAEDCVLDEGSPVGPVSLYAETNLESERLILQGFEGTPAAPTVVRFATIYGVSPRMRFDLVVNIMTAKAHFDRRVRVFGGDQWRPNVHVQDAARALLACLEAPAENVRGEVFNIGSNEQNYRIRELAEIVAGALPGTGIEMVEDSPDRRSYHVCFDKARRVLGFEARHGVREGVLEISQLLRSQAVLNYLEDRYHNVKRSYK